MCDIKKEAKRDERAFDDLYTKIFGASMAFVYAASGQTFDPKRPKVSPYVAMPDEKQVLIEDRDWESILVKWKDLNKELLCILQPLLLNLKNYSALFGMKKKLPHGKWKGS